MLVTTVIMAGLAIPLGGLLTSMAPLRAYAIDIAGSMAGILAFTLLSAAGTSAAHLVRGRRACSRRSSALGVGLSRRSLITAASMIGVLVCRQRGPRATSGRRTTGSRVRGQRSHALDANGVPHQGMSRRPIQDPFYEQIYRWFPDRHFGRVLIVGAGSGTDALELSHGVDSIDAVEIDPVIQAIGVRDHPDQPYSDPRVHRYVDDGRAFVRKATGTYDLVIFALPDSLTLVRTSANLRLESFLFTTQAFESVRDHLSPNGIFILYNYYREPWLVQKMAGMLETSFGSPPIVRLYPSSATRRLARGRAGGRGPPGGPRPAITSIDRSRRRRREPATDDWPFLYLRVPQIAPHYLVALGVVLLWALARRPGADAQRDLLPPVQPALLRPGRGVPAARDAQPRDVQPAVRLDLGRQLARLLRDTGVGPGGDRRQRALPDPQPAAVVHRPVRGHRGRLLAPPDALLIEPAWLRYVVAGGAHLRAGVRGEPRVQPVVPRHADRRHGVRVEPPGGDGRRGRGIPRPDHRLPGPAPRVVAGLYATAWVLATRVQLMADRHLAVAPLQAVDA